MNHIWGPHIIMTVARRQCGSDKRLLKDSINQSIELAALLLPSENTAGSLSLQRQNGMMNVVKHIYSSPQRHLFDCLDPVQ